ncbi:MAG: tyrosine recombinase XerC [Peptoniphilaceae bacterium]|nr:tyrosine recombinase XerC [Peptoniphilaceae bacterium]MDY6085518.1 tyrosine recombinase XerC [Peptoniphilaceae bacterium]
MDNPQILDDYLNYLKTIRGLSPKTIHEYGYDLSRFLRFTVRRKGGAALRHAPLEAVAIDAVDEAMLSEVTFDDLLSFLAYSENEEGLSASRRARLSSALRSFFKYLVTVREAFEKNPAEKLTTPKRKKRHPVYLTLEETVTLLKTAAAEPNRFFRARDVAILMTFLTTGMRLSELCGLNLNSIRDGKIHVIGKGNKERMIYITESCAAAIDHYRATRPVVPDEEALFLSSRNRRISPRAVQHRIEQLLEKAGFDTRIYTTHKLRHTAATLLYREGVDIRTLQRILGHESLSTTQIYTHVDDDQARIAVEKNPLAHLPQSLEPPED